MDISRGKQSVPARPSAQAQPIRSASAPASPTPPWWRRRLIAIVAAVAALAVGGVLVWWLMSQTGQQTIMDDRYQAVHLDNGQVFFGKLQNTEGAFLTLDEAYYTPERPSVASRSDEATVESAQLSLIKVGEEVYGPEHSVALRADSVRYWENLRADSKFVEAITRE